MAKGKLIAKQGEYEIRQYGTWVRGWMDAEGVYHEERGESPDITTDAIMAVFAKMYTAGAVQQS